MASNTRGSSIGFWSALALMFIAFKITGYIDWHWVWVLAPLWVPVLFVVGVVLASLMLSTLIEDR